jgi:hypothetical protein
MGFEESYNQEKSAVKYGEQAEINIKGELDLLPKFSPEDNTYKSNQLEIQSNNLFWDEVERLARIDFNKNN